MTDGRPKLLEAYRTHRDIGGAPEPVLEAWQTATEAEREELFDELLTETLLVDAFHPRAADTVGDTLPHRKGWWHRVEPRLRPVAAAAILLLVLGAGVYLRQARYRYPRPEASGDFRLHPVPVEGALGGQVRRGQRVAAGISGAALALGGYCQLSLSAGAIVWVRGEPGKEAVELEEGRLHCRVVPDSGEFAVVIPGGTLRVLGTEFETSVRYPVAEGENDMQRTKMSPIVRVAVLSGLVAYQLGDETGVLSAGMSRAFAAGPTAAQRSDLKKIASGKPRYRTKTAEAWKSRGRIVGRVRNCPGCKVKALDAKTKKPVESFSVKPGGESYELQWLPPGVYILLVTADGYEALDVHNLVVKVRKDLHVDLEF